MKKIWYRELGFFNNPFSIKPAAFHDELFGNSSVVSKIVDNLSESGMIFISGDFGTGKTTTLKKIIKRFRGSVLTGKNIIYYNCNYSDKSIDYDKLLIESGGFFLRLLDIRKRGMIILLDEVQDMNKRDLEKIKEYYDNGFFKLVVFVSKYDSLELTKELISLIGENRFKLKNMTTKEAVDMIRRRIGKLRFIDDEIIIKIFEKDKNSRNFLKNCEDVCRLAFDEGSDRVLGKHIIESLG